MINLDCDDLFDTWRQQARWLLSHEVDPSLVSWASQGVGDLFASDEPVPEGQGPFQARIPRALLDTLEQASRYRGDQRWSLLYEVLWRVSHGDRTAMMAGDKLGSELQRRIKQVHRKLIICMRLCVSSSGLHPARVRNMWLGMSRPTTFCTTPVSISSGEWAAIAG